MEYAGMISLLTAQIIPHYFEELLGEDKDGSKNTEVYVFEYYF